MCPFSLSNEWVLHHPRFSCISIIIAKKQRAWRRYRYTDRQTHHTTRHMTYGQTDMICRQTTRKTDQLQGLTVWRMRGRAWCAAWLQGCAAIFGSEAENNNITNDTSIQTIQNTLAVSYFTNGHLWMQSGLLLSLMNFVQEAGAIIFIQHTSNTRGIRWGLYRQEPHSKT